MSWAMPSFMTTIPRWVPGPSARACKPGASAHPFQHRQGEHAFVVVGGGGIEPALHVGAVCGAARTQKPTELVLLQHR